MQVASSSCGCGEDTCNRKFQTGSFRWHFLERLKPQWDQVLDLGLVSWAFNMGDIIWGLRFSLSLGQEMRVGWGTSCASHPPRLPFPSTDHVWETRDRIPWPQQRGSHRWQEPGFLCDCGKQRTTVPIAMNLGWTVVEWEIKLNCVRPLHFGDCAFQKLASVY